MKQMIVAIPATHHDLLESPLIAHLATSRPDGSPQSNPVWFEWDGAEIRISQTRARQKMRNIEHDNRVALSIVDPDNPYRNLEVRGRAVSVDTDVGNGFIDRLAQRYLNQSKYPWHQPGDQRVVVHIQPTDCSYMGEE